MRWNRPLERIAICTFALCVLAGISLGCSESAVGEGVADDADVSAPSPSAAHAFHGGQGYPGPWWRHGATREDFNLELRTCKGLSVAARRAATEDPPDAAYRAFLSCMDEFAWSRGIPSSSGLGGPG